MLKYPGLLVAGFLALAMACTPGQEYIDAGDSDAMTTDSAGSDTWVGPDPAAEDAGASDSQTLVDSAGSDTWVGPDSAVADSGGEDAALACTPVSFNDCVGISASGQTYTLSPSGHTLSGTHSVSIGDSLSEVQAAMAGEQAQVASFNAFAQVYCSEGLIFYFADNLGSVDADAGILAGAGQLSDDDHLYKMTAFGHFAGTTDTTPTLMLASSAAEVDTALPSPQVTGAVTTLDGGSGVLRFRYSGDAVVLVNGALDNLSLFAPQQSGSFNAALDFSAGQIGSVTVSSSEFAGIPIPSGSTIAQIKAALGPNPEALGDLEVDVSGEMVPVFVVSYSVLGLRFSAYANQTNSGDARKSMTAVISPPFQGQSSAGIGIGSTRAEVEANFGSSYGQDVSDSGATLYRYRTGQKNTGVVYAWGQDCVEHAALFVVNLLD